MPRTLRTDKPTAPPPGDPWRHLDVRLWSAPAPGLSWPADTPPHQQGLWLVNCPCRIDGCPGYTEIWQLDDGSALPLDWRLAYGCSRGCDVTIMAERLSAFTGQPAASYLPPVIVTREIKAVITGLIGSRREIRDAWAAPKADAFRSPQSQLAAFGYRLRDAGAPPIVVSAGRHMLAAALGVDPGDGRVTAVEDACF